MMLILPRPAAVAFFLTAIFYLLLVSFIQYPLTTLIKPIPILCLLMSVVNTAILPPWTKIILSFALFFSILGDVVLTLPMGLALQGGILSFLLVHCCYITLFIQRFDFRLGRLICFLPVLGLSLVVFYELYFHLDSLFVPVVIYFSMLLLMVLTAFLVKGPNGFLKAGAVSFWLSDSVLALGLFVMPTLEIRVFVMLTYYIAQFLIVSGIFKTYRIIEPLYTR